MAVDLRHLKYFLAVAEEGHITGAAERLGIQQPPLSRLIRAMERELDVQLFRRKARGVEVTPGGRAFEEKARTVLADLDEAYETTRSTARGERGRICVGATPTGPFHPLVPQAIRAFRQAYPFVSLTIEEHLSNELLEQVRNRRIDVAFAWTPPAEGLVVTPLVEDALVVALPRTHKLAQGRREEAVPLKALAADTFIIYGRKDGFGLYAATIVACHEVGFKPRFGQEARRLASALSLVAAELGVFLSPPRSSACRWTGSSIAGSKVHVSLDQL